MIYPEILFNDLGEYSPTKSLMLDQLNWEVKKKSAANVMREFDHEKWQEVRRWIDADPSILYTDVDSLRLNHLGLQPFFENGRFYLLPLLEAHAKHVALCARELFSFSQKATALVELGAGYGSTILGIRHSPEFPDIPLYAAEYSEVGVGVIRDLARNSGRDINVGSCDFYTSSIDFLNIPLGSIIFTSYAACYVPQLQSDFIEMLISLRPAAVFHFEPCFEHYSTRTIHGLMCRRYMQMNDYNQNLVSILHSEEKRGSIRIFNERPVVMGANPFLPISVLAWKPNLTYKF